MMATWWALGRFFDFVRDEGAAGSNPVIPIFYFRYNTTLKHLKTFFSNKEAEAVEESDAQAFVAYLRKNVSERTVKEYVTLVQSCWVWAAKNLPDNPWIAV
ncbi:MAG: hypothetical protein AAFY17_15495, partial [Cyanobacteria bacterium J06642_11]